MILGWLLKALVYSGSSVLLLWIHQLLIELSKTTRRTHKITTTRPLKRILPTTKPLQQPRLEPSNPGRNKLTNSRKTDRKQDKEKKTRTQTKKKKITPKTSQNRTHETQPLYPSRDSKSSGIVGRFEGSLCKHLGHSSDGSDGSDWVGVGGPRRGSSGFLAIIFMSLASLAIA